MHQLVVDSFAAVGRLVEADHGPLPEFEVVPFPPRHPDKFVLFQICGNAERGMWRVYYRPRSVRKYLPPQAWAYNSLMMRQYHELVHLYSHEALFEPPWSRYALENSDFDDPYLAWAEGIAEYAAIDWAVQVWRQRQATVMLQAAYGRWFRLDWLAGCVASRLAEVALGAQAAGLTPDADPARLAHWVPEAETGGFRRQILRGQPAVRLKYRRHPIERRYLKQLGGGTYLISRIVGQRVMSLRQLHETPLTMDELAARAG